MKSFKMKALSLAVLGLTGLGMAGAASAVTCGPANLSAWSGVIPNKGTVTVVPTGLEPTASACKMQATLTGNDPLATAAVYYADPSNEPTYHFRFYFNQNTVQGLTGLATGQIFAAASPNSFPASGPLSYGYQFQLGIIPGPGGINQLVAAVACNNAAQQYVCLTDGIPIAAGNHYVEGSMTVASGTGGSFKLWLDHNAAATVQPAADASVTGIDNSEWGGVNFVALGLGSAAPGFKLNQAFSFDAFDSRRQTFIGP